MQIELSQIVSQDARRSLGFPGVAQLLAGQPPHHVLEDLRKFFGQISRKLSHKPGQEQRPQTGAQCMSKWQAICIVKRHGTR